MSDIFGKNIASLKDYLDYHLERQTVISSNIANMNTPGFKAKDISFDDKLKNSLSLKITQAAHIQAVDNQLKYRQQTDPYERIGNDGNTVDLDREMMKMAQDNILYNASVEALQHELNLLSNTVRSVK